MFNTGTACNAQCVCVLDPSEHGACLIQGLHVMHNVCVCVCVCVRPFRTQCMFNTGTACNAQCVCVCVC